MDLRASLDEAWSLARVASPSPDGGLRTVRLTGVSGDARAAISPAGHLGLLIALAKGQRFTPPRKLQPGHGGVLEAEVSAYRQGDTNIRALAIWCRDSSLKTAFLAFCVSMLERAASGLAMPAALDACHAEFSRLLLGAQILESSVLAGLLGELIVLADLVDRDPALVKTWAGADRERHDFRRGPVSLEVKTSRRSESSGLQVHISSIDQLEPPAAGRLFLHAIRLEGADRGSISLATVVTRIESRLSGADLEQFRRGLEAHVKSTSDERQFVVHDRATYHVADDFPRLVPARLVAGRLDPGVSRVEYTLDLSSAQRHLVDSLRAFDELASGQVTP